MPSTTVTTNTETAATSVTITKPTGLAVGDLMLGYITCTAGSTFTLTTPSGWAVVQNGDGTGAGARKFAVYSRVATSGDVAASNFTFDNNGVTAAFVGVLVRCSGVAAGSEITTSEVDFVTSTSSPSFTGSSTPASGDSLVLMSISGWDTSGQPTVSGYASTPSRTWTEIADVSVDNGSIDPFCAVASAPSNSTSQITAYSATLSQSKSTVLGTIIIVRPPANATGTSALITTSQTNFTHAGSANATGTTVFVSEATTVNTQTGRGDRPTQWQNSPKPSTNWQNDTL